MYLRKYEDRFYFPSPKTRFHEKFGDHFLLLLACHTTLLAVFQKRESARVLVESLISFHLHVNTFVPVLICSRGEGASDCLFFFAVGDKLCHC